MSEPSPAPFVPLREDWSTAVAIVAHPDDMEYGAAAAIARWTGQGKKVVYVMATSGEAGIDSMHPDEAKPVREAEQIASAALVGVDVVEFLGLPDGVLEYGLALRREVARVVRRHRPDIVITNNWRETYGGAVPNQADHIATGKAVLDGARDAGNRWIFRELAESEGLEPWGGVKEIWAAGSPISGHAVDTTDTFAAGVASLEAHAAYLAGLKSGGAMSDPAEWLEGLSRMAGTRLGTRFAAPFEVVPLSFE
ncbi:PIG-L deacetylase family protein [Yinghuangia soli]|uniref:PIG-L family deacetylase n=1 Tax=Yinghuangia soli TaxID=2908204 RepID=A0AA41PZ71_9ACTN|nr:PIG-L deacetylase family protein [Yinghuangia soli]MCF2528292.1 PIG-L family deacetylase [Yinghuangia soli]